MKFLNSKKLFKKALKKIPSASQTYSKSYKSFNFDNGPLFLSKGKGAYVWDIDNNRYIDYVIGLLPNILGYNDNDVNRAIKEQLKNGISFSLPTKLEVELAELIISIIPSAEMVRFAKNGSDVTSAAVRLARAVTGKEIIISCGYHSWHDWYMANTKMDSGIPKSTKKLTLSMEYNDLNNLEKIISKHQNNIAALIIEPEGYHESSKQFLKKVREITKKNNIVLIFDEIISGFRADLGGAQKKYNIQPDLTTLGKAIANGMPLAALVGKSEVMSKMDKIFFSATNSGETLSIAAAIATIKKIKKHNIVENLNNHGLFIRKKISQIIEDNNLSDFIKVGGPSWRPTILPNENEVTQKESLVFFLRNALVREGIIFGTAFNLCNAHLNDKIISSTFIAFEKVLLRLSEKLKKGELKNTKNNFSVR